MAATQVARNPSLSGFDDLVKMPSSPNLSSRPRATSAASASTSSTAASAFNMRKVGLDENQPPPPPGSSPEVFFRYFLAVELRKAGTQPSEELLDRYVRNHFDSLFKNKNATAPSAAAPAATQQDKQQPTTHASTSQVTVAAVARPPAPPAKAAAAAAFNPMPAIKDMASPPELADTAESPALSGRSFSPIATPPALNSISEEDALGDFCQSLFGEPSSGLLGDPSSLANTGIKFEDDSDQILGFLRDSPFRTTATTEFESATIDPHVVENGAGMRTNFAVLVSSISPADLIQPQAMTFSAPTTHAESKQEAAPMSEDGISEDDHDDDHDDDDEHNSRQRGGSKGPSSSSKALSAIPMAVGDINHLKPDPEEYKKLSSKEKRQLRNKISARNFRTRRKEYITQLEEQIADRDGIIEALRQQISQLSMENKGLKDEVKELKAKTIGSQDVAKILEALQKTTMPTMGTGSGRTSPMQEMPLTPSGLVNFSGVQDGGSRPSTPSSPRPGLLRANTKKDLGTQQSSFWGGGVSVGGSFMPVC